MYLCYVDESGDGGKLDLALANSSPVMVIGGFAVPESRLTSLTVGFLELKRTFNPSELGNAELIDVVRHEIKGSNFRKDIRSSSRSRQRRAHGFLDKTLRLLEEHEGRIMARVLVKAVGEANSETSMYAGSVRALCANLQQYLHTCDSQALLILDSRNPKKNAGNVHGITVQKFDKAGDPLPGIAESPVFGHSDTHLALQIADVLISGILYPAACHTYAGDLTGNVHSHSGFAEVRDRYMDRVRKLQLRLEGQDAKWQGGVVVSNRRHVERTGAMLFNSARIPAQARESAASTRQSPSAPEAGLPVLL
ncbi:DUF3800 domain-containing protein [Saccharothrix sp. ST-888]|uniref:DUF3800 domain-containing protein n=1 Tax=Saccharothrix sp. ST-888 TaxID=1427391 RepID=UPI0005EC9614|nr:DUF3800 domain-containing protein [Saccharothrix sp. ST-888]KJK56314.1 hypothetical protein UK12_23505 [Saccharothrix sp. ST-888]